MRTSSMCCLERLCRVVQSFLALATKAANTVPSFFALAVAALISKRKRRRNCCWRRADGRGGVDWCGQTVVFCQGFTSQISCERRRNTLFFVLQSFAQALRSHLQEHESQGFWKDSKSGLWESFPNLSSSTTYLSSPTTNLSSPTTNLSSPSP